MGYVEFQVEENKCYGFAFRMVLHQNEEGSSSPPLLAPVSPLPGEDSSPDKQVDESRTDESFNTYNERMKNRRHHTKKERKTPTTARCWKKLEDPNAPRKPRSGYVHFLSDRRAKYGSVKQGASQKNINVALAAEWQALAAGDKEKYHEIARKERLDYEKAMAVYQKTEDYSKFQKQKELILNQRKKSRKTGIVDSIMLRDVVDLIDGPSTRKTSTGARTKSLQNGPEGSPTNVFSGEIFSGPFIEFNRQRESELRMMRREISNIEHEMELLQKSAGHDENFALRARIANDEKMLAQTQGYIQGWAHVAKNALANIAPPGIIDNPDSLISWLESVVSNPSSSADSKSVREALLHANFASIKY
ncbi:unnamed protein product [Caenorhabditis auriculariae]|uniref:HMG box domain-containing protein n=1 Tax=Caenorhabditis auriculariae TaxID=2777116 RepID=A0A8S1GNL8_9PELO|nr:unnamed protein product [Caenorhabditis auriculariae]